jgi:FtsH-binding integral membrane protein
MNSSDNSFTSPLYTAADASLSERKKFLAKVYSYVGLSGVSFSAACYLVMNGAMSPLRMHWGINLLVLFGGFFLVRLLSASALGLPSLLGLTFFIGWMQSGLIQNFLTHAPQAVIMAGGTTLLIFGGLTSYVLISKKDFSFMGGFLTIVTLIAMATILFSIIFGSAIVMSSVWAYLMVGLFSLWLLYDTSNILHHFGPGDEAAAAAEIFWDVLMIFLYLLQLFSGGDRD